MGSLPLVLITFNHGACIRTMRYLTDGSDPIKEINAISSLSPPLTPVSLALWIIICKQKLVVVVVGDTSTGRVLTRKLESYVVSI
jgi:hypothetical protein